MAVVISATVFEKVDRQGNPHNELWAILEFADAGYSPGGENLPLAPYMRYIDYMQMTGVSGALDYESEPNMGDFPGNAGSGRVLARYGSSAGLVILSGLSLPASGYLPAASGHLRIGLTKAEVLSGVALSGMRVQIHALGY